MRTPGNPSKVRSHLKSRVGSDPKPNIAVGGLQQPMNKINETTSIGYAPFPSTKYVKYKGPKTYNKGVKKASRR